MNRRLTLLLTAMACCVIAMAQDVTVSPKTGNMIPAVNDGYTETGWASGAFSMWRHKQLPLTVTVGDYPNLSSDGLMESHANNLYPNSTATPNENTDDNSYMVMLGGTSQPGYMTISLPRGMRFTRYRIVMKNNVTKAGSLSSGTSANVEFGECSVTGNVWNYTNVSGTYQNMGRTSQSKTTEYVVTRTSTTEGDMGNILYFKLQDSDNSNYQTVAFKSILLEFTSETPYTVPVKPSVVKTTGVSYVEVPFLTGKQDLGYIESRSSNGSTRNGYHKDQLKDIPASIWLYEGGAIGGDGKFPTSDNGQKTISQVRSGGSGYYRLAPAEGSDTYYYIETPEEARDQYGNKVYLSYRITGATIHYAKNVDASEAIPAIEGGSFVTYSSNGTTYYLQSDAKSWSATDKTEWKKEGSKLYTVDNGTKTYLRFASSSIYYVLSTTTSASEATNFDVLNDKVAYTYNGRTYYLTTSTVTTNRYLLFMSSSIGYTYPAFSVVMPQEASEAVEAQTLADYTLTVYGTDGDNPVETINVSGEGSYELTGLNNDAVKFKLSGTGLVRVDLQIEYLNPFINSMQVQMTSEANKDFKASQTFTATDFAVGGGTFDFQVPADLVGQKVNFTFSNLRSDYADNTYPWGSASHNSRYNFVKSDYFNLHNIGATTGDEAISFMGDNNINKDKANVADYDYGKKIAVDFAGNVEFKYNNADSYATEIANSAEGRTTLKEYIFTLENYANQKSLSGAAENGAFGRVTISPVEGSVASKNAFLVITDETRHNIAPTTEVQHRFHAFYDMTINANTTSYTTTASLVPIYDDSYYNGGGNGKFYGAVVTTTVGATGQSSIENAVTAIKEACSEANVDPGQLLYIDLGSQLAGVYTNSDKDYADIRTVFTAPNLLVFLPKNTTHTEDNFAYAETGSEELSFKAAANIVITDKQPFYSPYNIGVGAANYAKYDRLITADKNGKVTWATIVLPFTVNDLTEGVKTDADGNKFTVMRMTPTDAINNVNTKVPTAYFTAIADAQTMANHPYVVVVDPESNTADEGKSFSFRQYGSNIVATPTKEQAITTSESSTGNVYDDDAAKASPITFTIAGTYSGIQVPKEQAIYYFSHDGFYCSANLTGRYTTANVQPFRAYYTSTQSGAKLSMFKPEIGANSTTGIMEWRLQKTPDVVSGKGCVTITATADKVYTIVSAAGQEMDKVSLKAGEKRTIALPAGLYIVNDTKVIVK